MILCTFLLGELKMGIDIRLVQEIKRSKESTPVPGAPGHIRGMFNNRGRVTTLIDLRYRLGWNQQPATTGHKEFEVILKTRSHVRQIDEELANTTVFWEDSVALIVDQLGEVVEVLSQQLRPSPANMEGISGDFVHAVVERKQDLLVILDITKILGFGPEMESKETNGDT
uniref:Putative Chemotaxis protein cheW n=1 Tax=Magnetococcus massalia (strain MO-1) TaxID=451514 RepID=A0A1S7LK16_MAGMO|nr:putative Chemotaxis protein cheW [Candidatus Magnetococcus massalia]